MLVAPTGKAVSIIKQKFINFYTNYVKSNTILPNEKNSSEMFIVNSKKKNRYNGVSSSGGGHNNSDDDKALATIWCGTMHKLLFSFCKRPDIMFIDEASMLPPWLLAQVLNRYYHSNLQVVLIGDKNQISSIDEGELLRELIKFLPTTQLRFDCRRDNNTSDLALNISKLIHGVNITNSEDNDIVDDTNDNGVNTRKACYDDLVLSIDYKVCKFNKNMFYVQGTHDDIIEVVKHYKTRGLYKNAEDVYVITPFNGEPKWDEGQQKYITPEDGCLAINKKLRPVWVDNIDLIDDAWYNQWCIGDFIVMNENQNDIGIVNGDTGYIIGCNSGYLICKFGDQTQSVKGEENKKNKGKEILISTRKDDEDSEFITSNKIKLAWCVSNYKCQGGERKLVIYYVPRVGKYYTANRRSSFTAISRASELCICISPDINIMREAINYQLDDRVDNLSLSYNSRSQLNIERLNNNDYDHNHNHMVDPDTGDHSLDHGDDEQVTTPYLLSLMDEHKSLIGKYQHTVKCNKNDIELRANNMLLGTA